MAVVTPTPKHLPIQKLESRFRARSVDLGLAWQAVNKFAKEVARNGGTTYLVGGAVRDLLLQVAPADIDLEVHQLSPTDVERIATTFGPVSSVGQSFGILKIRIHEQEIDVSLPRRETKIGSGHRDFSVGIDPHMGVSAAAKRRDFSIGAIYLNVMTGELVDPHGGIADLVNRQLRSIDARAFSEDPLRLLRGLQLTARFDLTVDPATLNAMRAIVPSMGTLSGDRIRQEWEKIILSQRPSLGLELGRLCGYIEQWHPELAALWSTPQNPQQHPEGTVWNHTLLALDRFGTVSRRAGLNTMSQLAVGLGILTHDFGKPITTRNVEGEFRSDGHEEAGVEPAKNFLFHLGFSTKIIDHVAPLIRSHRQLDQLFRFAAKGNPIAPGTIRRLLRAILPATIHELLVVTSADQLGRGPFPRPDGLVAMPERYDGYEWWLKKVSTDGVLEPLEPILTGRDLVERGWPAGPTIGRAVRLADNLGLGGMSRTEILQILDTVPQPNDAVQTLESLVEAEAARDHHPAARSNE